MRIFINWFLIVKILRLGPVNSQRVVENSNHRLTSNQTWQSSRHTPTLNSIITVSLKAWNWSTTDIAVRFFFLLKIVLIKGILSFRYSLVAISLPLLINAIFSSRQRLTICRSTIPKRRLPILAAAGWMAYTNLLRFICIGEMIPVKAASTSSNRKGKYFKKFNYRSLYRHLPSVYSYPAEMHLVHWNVKYGSFAEASRYSYDGLAVLTVFARVIYHLPLLLCSVSIRHLLVLFRTGGAGRQ